MRMRYPFSTWSSLRKLSASRVVQSANIWAIIVPVAANLMEHVENVVKVTLFDHEFALHLTLPFSWKVLFIASIAFLIANIIFALFCPTLIKETDTYRDFHEQARSGEELKQALVTLTASGGIDKDTSHPFINWFNSRNVTYVSGHGVDPSFSAENEARTFKEAYAITVAALDITRGNSLVAAAFFYGVGIVSFAVLLIQNIQYVLWHW